MASKLYNRAGVLTTTAGAGMVTLGAALAAGTALNSAVFRTFASAGVTDGTIVRYLILDSNGAWEYGTGTYTTAGTTLSRTLGASSTGSLLVLSGSAQVFITAIAEDIVSGPASSTDKAVVRWNGTTGLLVQDTSLVTISDLGAVLIDGNTNADLTFTLKNANTGGSTRSSINIVNGDATRAGYSLIADHTAGSNYIYANPGALLFGTGGASTLYMISNNVVRALVDGAGSWMIGNDSAPGGVAHVEIRYDSAATNTVVPVARTTATSTGTPAAGTGVSTEYAVETAANNIEVGATISAVTTDVTDTSEDFELIFKTMTAGATATEKGRTGFMPESMTLTDNITLLGGYSIVVNSSYTIPASLLLTIGAGAIMRIF